ncbi:hypothetical protein DL764_008581 [Monosporascus ibericus]|uniref:Potassium channel domain-containing protein n=1 Tax=Monosporascus ibericus TaxID=155417 RepID=A0A4V1X979_9PEZI|nr:hypothetical protein DL764_008581 [Monosporascus ibericus]
MDDGDLGDNVEGRSQAVDQDNNHRDTSNGQTHLDPTRWWFASAAFPMVAGTLGPVASAFSICALVEKWRQMIPPGSDITKAEFIQDPVWLLAVNGVQLIIAVIANVFLLLNMTKRVRFSIAQPITIVGWYISAICLVALAATAGGPLIPEDDIQWVWGQAFYYGVYAAILYFTVASLMVVTVWGANAGHYEKDFELTTSQRTLMLQTLAFLVYLLLGALIFSSIENWKYLDGVYWADVTLFTVGYGDYAAATTLGRVILMPYALVGVTSLGLVIGSIRNLALERGKRRLDARMLEKKRRKLVRHIARKGNEHMLEPVDGEIVDVPPGEKNQKRPPTEFERRQKEFQLMRKIQDQVSTRRRWTAMAISTTSWLVLWLVGAWIFQAFESPYQGWGYFDAFYFAYTGLTTIGYGDVTPVSNGAKSFFVFWSLLALPTMTVFLSNAGDTIVKVIRDGTLRLGDMTILPSDVGIRKEAKQLLARLSCGVLFADEDIEESPPGFFSAARPTGYDEGDTGTSHTPMGESNNENKPPTSGSDVTDNIQSKVDPKQHAKFASQNHASARKEDIPLKPAKTRARYHLILIDEIVRVTKHLQQSPPRKYTFREWAWFLRLIGEDEGSVETHRRARERPQSRERHIRPEQSGPNRDGRESRGDSAEGDEASKWSWIGHRSPLMDTREEAEWILGRLEQKLREELQSVVTEQAGKSGLDEARSEEESNERKPMQ